MRESGAVVESDHKPGSPMHEIARILSSRGIAASVGGMAALLFATAAYQDAIAASPRAPVGTLAMALFALWQAYRQPAPATPSRVVAVPAKLCALAAAGLLLAMLMVLGHSIDGLIFGGVHQPVNSIVVFVFAVELFVFVRNSEQRMDPE